ncbi:MAG TPA: RsmB/NOP family class I SAM-dependent RNA methyltransferase [Opitutaceae bacterium]|nr:RsmB/NOP family class I SAM-dependent RNA methyltransferase [Opitutaceae bacterium]
MNAVPPGNPAAAWSEAARLVGRWFDRRERIDELMERLPRSLTGVERARCQHLVYGVVRHEGRLNAALGRLVPRPPRLILRAILYVAGYELLEAGLHPEAAPDASGAPADSGLVAKVVHHAVERAKTLASPAEARLVNAVVRRLAGALAAQVAPPRLAAAGALAEYYSHPGWLVARWLAQYGADTTRALLEWNQQPAPVYARWRTAEPPPNWLGPTRWPGFFEVPSGHWSEVEPLLAGGQLYLQDPSARFAIELLAPQAGETVLDLCAAPGGKTLQIADALGAAAEAMKRAGGPPPQTSLLTPAATKDQAAVGRVIAVDLPGERLPRLRANLTRVKGVEAVLVEANVAGPLAAALVACWLPDEYAAVLIDVPCSNTGVMRHRVDVKWRLQEGDFARHAQQQLALLSAAARCVAPGGRLVYSTCSIDPEENERVVAAFLRDPGEQFTLETQVMSLPWETGCDGMGAFRLRRNA